MMIGISLDAADFPAGFEARTSRHIHIEQDQVHVLVADLFERFIAGSRFHHRIAVRGERGPQHAADLRLVVDDQHGCGVHACTGRRVIHRQRKRKHGTMPALAH